MLGTELLRLVTCGSVDDGKSTLLGRLLFDTKQIMADQLEHIEQTSARRGDGYVNLALLTDGLRAEREQGITIDVAYRSFVTPRRRFQLADAPGHVQYTRNMVTGASTAELAIVLLDARKGEHVRVFPISNWTELDVWQYVAREELELPPIYFAHEREVFRRDGMLYACSEYVERLPGEECFTASVRFRTVGDMSCTGGVLSEAATIDEVVDEIAATRVTERGETRADDRASEAAMEDRKRVGYF